MVLRGMLRVVIFAKLKKERIALAALRPPWLRWTRATSPCSERPVAHQRAHPSHFVCSRRWEWSGLPPWMLLPCG